MSTLCELIADLFMLVYALYSVFVFLGLVLALSGLILGWRWTRQRWLRTLHLGAVLLLGVRVWTGVPCPFSIAEDSLRRNTAVLCPLGGAFHDMLHRLAFRGNDPRQFARSANVFGAFVILTFVLGSFMPSITKYRRRGVANLSVH